MNRHTRAAVESEPRARRGPGPVAGAGVLLVAALTLAWGCVVRTTADHRRVAVHRDTTAAALAPAGALEAAPPAAGTDTAPATDTVRVLAWNIAHGRGDLMQGNLQNFRGGDLEVRSVRFAEIAETILAADADIVVLNEVDFHAAWSRGLNQARMLAWATGYPTRVEQRNFDYSVLFADFAFGNAVLTRLPVRGVRHVPIPAHSELEAALIGAKSAAVVELDTRVGPIAVVPIHLEFRSEATRRAAVPALQALRGSAPPLILAGDFNTGPPGWPRTPDTTAVGALLDAGFTSLRADGPPAPDQLTFPAPAPRRAIDWVLAEPPLRVLEARVLHAARDLSDHLPVLAVVEVR